MGKVIELNGQQHKEETIRDAEKAAIVRAKLGFDTVEIWNWETFKPDYRERLRTRLGLH